jgi:hypothetical protein
MPMKAGSHFPASWSEATAYARQPSVGVVAAFLVEDGAKFLQVASG